jgi:hypothetical protein
MKCKFLVSDSNVKVIHISHSDYMVLSLQGHLFVP